MNFKNRGLVRPYMPRGTEHYRSRFSEEDVLTIRRLRSGGMGYAAIGKQYGCRSDTIRNCCLGYTYSNLGGPTGDQGASGGRRRIDERTAAKIRGDYANGMSFKRLCQEYGIGMVSAHKLIRQD